MRSVRWTVTAFLLVLAVPQVSSAQGAAAAVAAPCDAERVLEDYLRHQETVQPGTLLPGDRIVAYDHRRGDRWWRGYRWECPGGAAVAGCGLVAIGEPTFEIRPEGHPRLTVPRSGRLHAFVVGTNPLAYTVTAGDSKEADHEDLADLQQLALLAGSTASTAAATLGTELFGLDAAVAAAQVQRATAEDSAMLRTLQISPSALAATPTPGLQDFYDAIVAVLTTRGQELQKAFLDLQTRAKAVGDSLAELEAIERVLRAVETGDTAAIVSPLPAAPSEATLHLQFEELAKARTALEGKKPICPKDLSVLLRAIELRQRDLPPTTRPAERAAHVAELDELIRHLGSGDVCTDLRLALGAAATWFRAHPATDGVLPRPDDALLKALAKVIEGYRAGFEKKEEPLALTKTLLEKRGTVGRRASLLAFVRTRQPGFSTSPPHCALTHGVVPVSRADGQLVDVPWSKVRTEPFKIAFDQSLKDVVTPTRADREDKYELQMESLWRNFDIDLGLVHSGLEQPTYSAVAASTVDATDGGGDGTASEKETELPLVIARTQTEALSGDVAMFVSWLPDRLQRGGFSMGPQIGFGLDDDRPAAFAGIVFSIGRFLNLSGGWSWQEIEDLAPGVAVGDVVTSADDIRRHKDFEDDWYAALTITLDDLPFFGGGDDDD